MFGLVEFECRILTRKWVLWFTKCLKSLCGWWPNLSSVVQSIVAFCCWANADQNRRKVERLNMPHIKKCIILMPVYILNFFDWSHIYQDITVQSIYYFIGDPNFFGHNSFSWVKIRLYILWKCPKGLCGGWWVGGWWW
jgi:hypothetical protein